MAVNIKDLLNEYPIKRISPTDGMVVTAKVWEEAHEYHRRSQRYLTLFGQGSGIITGLEVIASDPADTSVYILPGIAIDTAGEVIILSQPVAYDIGHDMEGVLYLLLAYGESSPRSDNGDKSGDGPRYVHAQFSITAQTNLPNAPYVELARVHRTNRRSTFHNAQNPTLPGLDQIDLRFRQQVGAPKQAKIAVSYVGDVKEKKQGLGISYLAQSLNHTGNYNILIEDSVEIGPSIVTNTLVYLVGQGTFEFDSGVMNGLRNYVSKGNGTLLIESLDEAAENSFLNFLRAKDMQPKPLPPGHRLLTRPHLFAEPCPGFETKKLSKMLITEGVIFSTYNHGLMWQGERRGGVGSREEIRSAMEWGGNIITYALERRL